MKKLIISLIYLTALFTSSVFYSCEQKEKEKVCLRIYMQDGRNYEKSFMLPKNRSALQVNTSKGSYYLQYVDERWWDRHWHTVKNGVIDFEYVSCK